MDRLFNIYQVIIAVGYMVTYYVVTYYVVEKMFEILRYMYISGKLPECDIQN